MPETQLQAPGGVREGLAPGCRPTRSSYRYRQRDQTPVRRGFAPMAVPIWRCGEVLRGSTNRCPTRGSPSCCSLVSVIAADTLVLRAEVLARCPSRC